MALSSSLSLSRAATPTSSLEVETGTLSGPVTKIVNNASSSANESIKFGSASQTNFVHPGVFVSKPQLDFVKAKINQNQEPWMSAYNQLKSSSLSSKSYTPKPVPILQCSASEGISAGYPQAGCAEMNNDGAAVYAQALMYYFTGDVAYANKAVQIMNAWSSTLTSIPYDQPRLPNGNPAYWQNLLVVGWSTETMLRGAEIIKYTSTAMSPGDASNFESLVRGLYYPLISTYTYNGNGNGGLTWSESLVNMGIYLDDTAIYNEGITMWKDRAKALVYVSRDGAQPLYPKNLKTGGALYGSPALIKQLWYSPSQYISGLEQETCRDMGHTFMGLGPMANVAETARIQGEDLYGNAEYKDRFLAGFELNADYVNQMLDQMAATGQTATQVKDSSWTPTNWVCPDFKDGGGSAFLGQEIAYNHFANRLGIPMPKTKKLIERVRPKAGGNHLFWEALTNYNAP